MWPTGEKGRFESSDPDLNAIWTTAVATLRSNMHDFYLDGIRRDGLLWHDGPLTLDAYERAALERALRECGGDASRAARRLGIGRSTFYRKLARRGAELRPQDASSSAVAPRNARLAQPDR
jgi:transcriptional regulator of acetoin/glycerol metabolism